jgi:hypothetical protein
MTSAGKGFIIYGKARVSINYFSKTCIPMFQHLATTRIVDLLVSSSTRKFQHTMNVMQSILATNQTSAVLTAAGTSVGKMDSAAAAAAAGTPSANYSAGVLVED